MHGYHIAEPGEVLALDAPLPDMPVGHWVLLAIEGAEVYLSRMGENEDGDFCTTRTVVAVGLADLDRFRRTGLTLDALPVG